jgi:hypothetical protein
MKRGLLVIAVVLACGSLALGGDMIGISFVGGTGTCSRLNYLDGDCQTI